MLAKIDLKHRTFPPIQQIKIAKYIGMRENFVVIILTPFLANQTLVSF